MPAAAKKRSRTSGKKPAPSPKKSAGAKKYAAPPKRSKSMDKHADASMSDTALQKMAKQKGIPFGGVPRSKLIERINAY